MNPESLAHRQRSHLLLLGLIVAFALALRCFSLSSLGFWTDELCTLSCSHGWGLQFDKVPLNQITPPMPAMTRLAAARPFREIVPAMAADEAHPPLYFLLLRLWEDIFGDSESAVRSLDVLFSVTAIALLFFTAQESIGATAALWACLIMAVAEPQIQFSQEARNYMPVVTFSLAGVWAIQQLRRRPRIRYAGMLGGAVLAMMLTHYFAAGVAVALGVHVLTSLRRRARWLGIYGLAAAAILFLVLWGPYLHRQWPHFQSNYAWIADAGPGHTQRVAINLLNLPWRLVAELPHTPLLQLVARLCGSAFFVLMLIAFIRRPPLRLWVLWVFCSIGIVVAVDLLRSTAQLALLRYTLFTTPAVYVLLAAAVPRGRWRWVLPAFAVLLGLLSLPTAYVPPWKTDFRPLVQIVANRLGPRDGLLITGADPIADGVMLAAFQHYLPAKPATVAVLTKAPDLNMIVRLRLCPHVWVIQRWPVAPMPLRGFVVEDHASIPYFAELQFGRFDKEAPDVHPGLR